MKTVVQEKNWTIPQRRFQTFFDGDHGVYCEENFIEMLAFERKRSERSGKPFQLMTLTIFGISDPQSRCDIMKRAVEALLAVSRDTDIMGWYKRASILGVIFTETDTIKTATLREMFYQRLRARLTEAQLYALELSIHTYPNDRSPALPGSRQGLSFEHLNQQDDLCCVQDEKA
jgi:hypothetical protein